MLDRGAARSPNRQPTTVVKKQLIAASTTEAPAGDRRPATITITGPMATSGMQYVKGAAMPRRGICTGMSPCTVVATGCARRSAAVGSGTVSPCRGGSSAGQSSGLIIRQVVGSNPTRPTSSTSVYADRRIALVQVMTRVVTQEAGMLAL